jgi:hypothetical protein
VLPASARLLDVPLVPVDDPLEEEAPDPLVSSPPPRIDEHPPALASINVANKVSPYRLFMFPPVTGWLSLLPQQDAFSSYGSS